jgi:prepilin-type N-terminal cleavage/methylation domain-containing protein
MTQTLLTRPLFSPVSRRGFTLTEIAIVLGIIGIILGAIWAAAAMVYENNRTKESREQALAVINNWRSIYGSRQVDVATDGTDMTQLTVNNSFAPSEMLTTATGACLPGGTAVTCFLAGPWTGSQVNVEAYQTHNAVAVTYSNMTQTACNHFGNAIADAAGLIETIINGTTLQFPPLGTAATLTTSQVSAECSTTGNGNSILAMFAMN